MIIIMLKFSFTSCPKYVTYKKLYIWHMILIYDMKHLLEIFIDPTYLTNYSNNKESNNTHVTKRSNYSYNKLQQKMTKKEVKEVNSCTFDIYAVGWYTALIGS